MSRDPPAPDRRGALVAAGLGLACGGSDDGGRRPPWDAGAYDGGTTGTTTSSTCYDWDPCWTPVAWSDCVEWAQRPERTDQTPLVWEPCPWAPNGCWRSAQNWEGTTGHLGQIADTAAGRRIGLSQYWPYHQRAVIFAADGTPEIIWRVSSDNVKKGCLLSAPLLASAHAWLVGGNVLGGRKLLLGAPYADVTTATATAAASQIVAEGKEIATNEVFAGRLGGRIQFVERQSGASHVFGGPDIGSYGQPRFVDDDTALVQCLYAYNRPKACLWTRSQPEVMTKLIDPPGEVVPVVATDGETLVWVQNPAIDQPGGGYPQGDIWTSPYTANPAAIVPTKRVPAPPMNWDARVVAGAGYFALGTMDLKVHVYRLSDMHHWSFDWPEYEVLALLRIEGTEVWYMTGAVDVYRGIVRQSIEARGPGE